MTDARIPALGAFRYWHPDELPSVELFRTSGMTHLWRVYHRQYTFCVVSGAGHDLRYRRRTSTVRAGMLQILEPGELHVDERSHGPTDLLNLSVDQAALLEAAAAVGRSSAGHFSLAFDRPSPAIDALRRLHRAVASDAEPLPLQTLLADALITLVLHHGEDHRRDSRPPGDSRAVGLARAYLHAHWAERCSLDDLAAATGVSKFHLVRQFHDEVGLPPHAYQIVLRTGTARRLIAAGRPIAEVAVQTGFAAQSHLHRHFLRAYGVTPGQYARASQT